ncbi:hypothetical protein B296_00008142 [Ensete ventricosum]|uniref:Uncharacterized protein n=1 Tax=Ensete ventricosum TaxID=4639 RepID=A0A426YPV7_ENSVE|nr:hypothetical protein B296_00008142 [Ensete ventricosum]
MVAPARGSAAYRKGDIACIGGTLCMWRRHTSNRLNSRWCRFGDHLRTRQRAASVRVTPTTKATTTCGKAGD